VKRRRDATRIIYELLRVSKHGVSKTRAVYQTNLNFHLMREYLSFLLGQGYLQRIPNGSAHDTFKLTSKGVRLLKLLDELEREVKVFRPPTEWPEQARKDHL